MAAPKACAKGELHRDGPTGVMARPIDRNDRESGRDCPKEAKDMKKEKECVDWKALKLRS